MTAFHEMAGEFEAALSARRRELAEITDRDHIARECRTRLHICRLLRTLGHPKQIVEAELRGVEQSAARLKAPTRILNEVSALRNA